MICDTLRRSVSTLEGGTFEGCEFETARLQQCAPFRETSGGFSVTLKRNCSMSPYGLLGVFAALTIVSLAIGIGFALAGAWLVLPFVGLEILGLGAAFLLHARHAADYERIELVGARLHVEVAEADRVSRREMAARWAEVVVEGRTRAGPRIWLRGREGDRLEIGRHLAAAGREAFARELRTRLRSRTGEWSA